MIWDVRTNYRSLTLWDWSEDELLAWLWDEGVWTCGDDGAYGGTLEDARTEVALQSELIGVAIPDADEVRERHQRDSAAATSARLMTPDEPPIVAGGQGREDEHAQIVGSAFIALAMLAVFVVCRVGIGLIGGGG